MSSRGFESNRDSRSGAEDGALVEGKRVIVTAFNPAGLREQRLESDLRFETRQVGADAVVDTKTEGDMGIRAAGNVEQIRAVEDFFVAIRRANPAKDDAVLGDLYALQRDRPRGPSWVELNRRSEAEDFVDGGRHEARTLS